MHFHKEAKANKKVLFTMLFLCFFFSSLMLLGTTVHAQEEDISIGINPANPGPNETTVVGIESFLFDLARSRISWSLNGVPQKSGVGEKTFSFITGTAGNVSRIGITIEGATGEKVNKTVLVRPQALSLLWQANTYTPPWYKGKALPGSESIIAITAFPELVDESGARINPTNLFYSWGQDGSALGSLSGVGKRSVVLKAKTVPRDETAITLSVSSLSGETKATKQLRIQTNEPRVILYKKHPLAGVLTKNALADSTILTEEELSLQAEPYFFSLGDLLRGSLDFEWSLNNAVIPEEKERGLILRNEDGKTGVAKIDLLLRNFGSALQEARTALFVSFGN